MTLIQNELRQTERIAAFLVSPSSASSSEATRPSPPGGEGQTLRPKAQGLGEAKGVPNSF